MKREFTVDTFQKRSDFEELLLELLSPMKMFFSEQKAWVKLGDTGAHFSEMGSYLEGFSRPLWGLASLWAGKSNHAEFEELYRKGLVAGTDPTSEEYWGDCRDYDQKLVEMGAISYALIYAKDKIWDPLSEKEKEQVVTWISQMNQCKCYDCNWHFFAVLVNLALHKLGQPYDKQRVEISLDFMENCYMGNGWYTDGMGGDIDYYVPFAIQFYSLVYAHQMREEDPVRSERYIQRALEFGKEFAYWFSPDGSALPYGRSLTYRFAQVAFYSLCVAMKIEPLPMAIMKGIIVKHLQYWMNLPIFDNAGILTIGYGYQNLYMAESYNSPCSPYWAMKAFAFLMLPEEELFWELPMEELPFAEEIKHLKKANMIIQRCKNGKVVAFSPGRLQGGGHTHTDAKYNKFAYATRHGFCVPVTTKNAREAAQDSVLSFELFGQIFSKKECDEVIVKEDYVSSVWSPISGIRVKTEIFVENYGHRRIHEIESDYDCVAYDAGFALSKEQEGECQVECLQGKGEKYLLEAIPNSNILYPIVKIPGIRYFIRKGMQCLETKFIYN